MFPSPPFLSRDPSQLARPPKAPTRKGPSIFALLGVSALSFAYFTYVVAKRAEEGDHGRKRTVSPLTPDVNMPVDEFYRPGERYPTLDERRELLKAAALERDRKLAELK